MNNEIQDFWPMNDNGKWLCCVCNKEMGGNYEPPLCCSGHECGCQGKPTEPNICSSECWEKALTKPSEVRK